MPNPRAQKNANLRSTATGVYDAVTQGLLPMLGNAARGSVAATLGAPGDILGLLSDKQPLPTSQNILDYIPAVGKDKNVIGMGEAMGGFVPTPGSSGLVRAAKTAVTPSTYQKAFMQAQAPAVMSNMLPDGTPYSADQARKLAKKLEIDYDNPIQRGEYVGGHQAPAFDAKGDATMANLSPAFGDDIYSSQALRYFGEGGKQDAATIRAFQTAKDNPLQEVTVYRAVPNSVESSEINPYDWVTPSLEYAKQHGNYFGEGSKILKKKVPAGSLFTEGNSINEFGYDPFGLFKEIVD